MRVGLFRQKKTIQINPRKLADQPKLRDQDIPDDFLTRCPNCQKELVHYQVGLDYTCPHCHDSLQFPARKRLYWLLDKESFIELELKRAKDNPLDFPGYDEKLKHVRAATGEEEAVIAGFGTINQIECGIGVMDSRFLMASMGTRVGEILTVLFEQATKRQLPVILYIASGGARMQEGILSLMQMAKVSQAVAQHGQAGLFYLALLTHPTTGGVTASFAMQADIILAESKATIGFAGKRVIEQTIKSSLPLDFQSAEKVMEYGFIDQIVTRSQQKETLTFLLRCHQKKENK